MRVATKEVRGADGKLHTLYSYDGGASWALDYKDVQKRQRAVENFQEYRERKNPEKYKKRKIARSRPGLHGPVILPVRHHGSPILGKEKGKPQKFRRNLRSKPPTASPRLRVSGHVQHKPPKMKDRRPWIPSVTGVGLVPKPVHRHKCYNADHPKSFNCMCDEPKRKLAWCGETHCLRERFEEVTYV